MTQDRARKQRILEAASDLITHYGYDKTTVNDIAREAGISKGAVYLHFKSKEALFEALVLHETMNVMDEMVRRIENDPEGGTFFNFYSTSLLVTNDNPLLRALLTQDKRVLGDLVRQMRADGYYTRLRPLGDALIIQFQEAGLLRQDLSPKMITYLLTILRLGFFISDDLIPPDEVPEYEEFSHVLPDFISRALTPPENTGSEHSAEAGKQIIANIMAAYKASLKERAKDDE